jgi:hypothetical protein
MQSLIIGWFSLERILVLREFSTDNVKINHETAPPTPRHAAASR